MWVHEKLIYRGKLPKNGGAWTICRFKGGGDLTKKWEWGWFDTSIHTIYRAIEIKFLTESYPTVHTYN